MAVVFVLLATVAGSSLDIVVTGTLTLFVALSAFRSTGIAVTSLATFRRESILVSFALVAAQSSDSGFAEALTGVGVAGGVVGSDRVTAAAFTTFTARDIPEAVLALVTVVANDVRLAVAIARD
jgi:hypothetical protein